MVVKLRQSDAEKQIGKVIDNAKKDKGKAVVQYLKDTQDAQGVKVVRDEAGKP